MTTIINGSSPSVTFSDGTTQTTAFTTGAVTQSTIATGVAGTGPAFSAYQNSVQTVSSSSFTKVTFDAEEYDTNNNFASSRFTPTVAGYYQINACVTTSAVNQTRMITSFYKNGSTYKNGTDNNSGCYALTMGTLAYLNGSTDYIEVYVYMSASGNLQASSVGTYFNGSLVRAA